MLSVEQNRLRGPVLTTWLVFLFVISLLATIVYTVNFMTRAPSDLPEGSVFIFIIMYALQTAGVYGILIWKKWGVYLYVAATAIILFVGWGANAPQAWTLTGLGAILITALLTRTKWSRFR
jgi:hypothetical protein